MPKRFANPTWTTRLGMALCVCIVLLGWLSYHLLTYDYKVPGSATQGRDGNQPGAFALKPLLKIVDGRDMYGEAGVCAAFSLVNSGRSKLRIVNTRALVPLYEMTLMVREPGGGTSPAPMTLQQMAALRAAAAGARKGFDPAEDTVVELLGGEALVRTIRLHQFYDMQRTGTYELTVTYQPAALEEGEGPKLAELGVEEMPLTCSALFEVPLEKKPASTPPAEPAAK